ncbi:UNVERIFIED_CONTAM: hypothetical protein GTU68_028265 [Idotea baltica]|nr:hypothetical protein [Idotea baltica]
MRRSGANVSIWGRNPDVLKSIEQKLVNPQYVKNLPLASGIKAESDVAKIIRDKQLIVIAIPSSVLRKVIKPLVKDLITSKTVILSGIKGLESDTFKTATQVLADELGSSDQLAALGGPSFAAEVIQGYPTAVTVAGYNQESAELARRALHFGNVRAYLSSDVLGVEYGGAIKNVIALATGIVDGVGMGHNARAALITRGLAEIQQLVVALGGDSRTIAGLSGLGDLLLTAVGDLSRNRQVGLRLGRGEKLEDIQRELGQVAEGVRSTGLVLALAKKHGIDMPIVEQTEAVLSNRHSVDRAVAALLAREPKQEVKSKES